MMFMVKHIKKITAGQQRHSAVTADFVFPSVASSTATLHHTSMALIFFFFSLEASSLACF